MFPRRKLITILVFLALGFATSGLLVTPFAGPSDVPAPRSQPTSAAQSCAGFYIDFSSSSLGSGWTWINEDDWSLSARAGYLRISTNFTEDNPTYLLRQTSGSIDAIWSRLEVEPATNLQHAGIAVYQDEDNWLRLTRESASNNMVFFVFTSRLSGQTNVGFAPAGAEATRSALRIRRQGEEWILEYDLTPDDGSTDWTGVWTFQADLANPQVGLVASAGENGRSPVDFDDFCLETATTVTPTPTPTTTPGDLTLTGRVYDAVAGPARGISGATVSVLTCLPRRYQTLSGSDGRYSLFVPAQYLTPCNAVTLEVWRPGYDMFSRTVAIADLYDEPERDFALTPLPNKVYLPLVVRAPTSPPPPPPPPPTPTPTSQFDPTTFDLELELIADGFSDPVQVTHAGDGSGRLFVVERAGTIRIVDDGQVKPAPFLDITGAVGSSGAEQGLLSVAFDPDYAANGLFFVDYTDTDGDTVVARYSVSDDPDVADATSAQMVLTVDQPAGNHNGGLLLFGPDGYLYVGTGDGGLAGDPWGNAHNPDVLLGKLLRIDVNAGTYAIPPDNPFVGDSKARDEIWALGLRNPWRYSFDRATGDLYIADVGQNAWEEVDFQPASSQSGQNYGWDVMEGTHCYEPREGCDQSGLTLPVAEYSHDLGCSVTGGYVYRGSAFPRMAGAYYLGDYCSGRIWALYRDEADAWTLTEMLDTNLMITSFGEDEAGELYLVSLSDAGFYRLVAGE